MHFWWCRRKQVSLSCWLATAPPPPCWIRAPPPHNLLLTQLKASFNFTPQVYNLSLLTVNIRKFRAQPKNARRLLLSVSRRVEPARFSVETALKTTTLSSCDQLYLALNPLVHAYFYFFTEKCWETRLQFICYQTRGEISKIVARSASDY